MKLEVAVTSVGTRVPHLQRSPEKARTVFRVEVWCDGRRHCVEKRYSEFYALHKRIKKSCQVPDFPPKRVPNWMAKVLEQRRLGLEAYLQGVILQNQTLPNELLVFLKVQHEEQDPRLAWSEDSLQEPSPCYQLSHRPVVNFQSDPYVFPSSTEMLPNTILSGVLQGFYTPETVLCLEAKFLMDLRLPPTLLPANRPSAPLPPI